MAERKVSRRKFVKLALLGTGVATVGYQIPARNRLVVERHTLALPRWDANGFKIAFISDFHLDNAAAEERALDAVKLAAQERPDVIAFGGDITSGHREPDPVQHVEPVFRLLGDVAVPVVGITGNHDFWHTQSVVKQIFEQATKFGMRLLRNQQFEIQGVTINGLDDGFHRLDRHDRLPKQCDKNIITLFHEPDYVTRIDKRASLMLAGHSHGGQICLPFGVKVYTPTGAKQYWSGFYENAPVPLYVSRGVGMVGPPIRTFCPPEVSILTLVSA